ncbi:helix-turn-helix domain-containing protein [Streptomyces sp. NPDC091281]|uniref:helix-turn-helix domain-containing protein n=1 Tax=Streptomyces sp. NPDC091281 TaxID=3365985 RepID=UPI00382059DF
MSTYRLDVPELHRRLDAKRRAQGLTWRQVADRLDLSSSTLSRIGDGHRPDADALVTLLVWLDLDTDLAIMIKPKEGAAP